MEERITNFVKTLKTFIEADIKAYSVIKETLENVTCNMTTITSEEEERMILLLRALDMVDVSLGHYYTFLAILNT